MNPTIRDVARLAGTSKSTVSRFLNGQTVKKKTQEALEKAIEELNFHPNVHARRLVLNKTRMIGIIVNDISNVFYSGMIKGIESAAVPNGYGCVYYSWDSGEKRESDFVSLLHEGQVDGLIFISFRKRLAEDLSKMEGTPFPIVLVGDDGGSRTLHSVEVDNAYGVAESVRYLHGLGHRRIAYISGPELTSPTGLRLQGYLKAVAELGLESRKEWIADSDWSNEGGYRAMTRLLDSGGFTAVVSSNDETAVGALNAVRERGMSVPGDISITGFDDIHIARWVYPPLTTVRQPFHEIGAKAAEGLIGKIGGSEPGEGSRVLLKPHMVIRDTCSAL